MQMCPSANDETTTIAADDSHLKLWWQAESQWYTARVVRVVERDAGSKEHLLQYDDGSFEWTYLPDWKCEVVTSDEAERLASSAAAAAQRREAVAPRRRATAASSAAAPAAAPAAPPPPLEGSLPARWPERRAQVEVLSAAFTGDPAVASIAVFGPSATGKTLVTRQLLEALEIPHAYVDCRWSRDVVQLLQSVLDALGAVTAGYDAARRAAKSAGRSGTRTLLDFVEAVAKLRFVEARAGAEAEAQEQQRESSPPAIVLVLDHAEKLLDVAPASARGAVLSTMLRLQAISGQRRLCVVTVSEAPLASLARHGRSGSERVEHDVGVGLQPALRVRFGAYTSAQLEELLRRTTRALLGAKDEEAESGSVALHAHLCALVFKIFERECAGLDELRVLQNCVVQLWPHARRWLQLHAKGPAAPRSFTAGMGRELDAALWPRVRVLMSHPSADVRDGALASRRTSATESASVDVLRELPQRSKMLLLAAFLCSHNPPEQDMLIFSPEGVRGGRRKKQRSGGQQARAAPIGQGGMTAEQRRRADISEAQHSVSAVKQRFVGPLPFPWERLLAVLHSIQAIQTGTAKQRSSAAPVLPLWNDANRLIHLQLLQRLPPQADFTALRLRCTMGYATVARIAASMEPAFPLNQLLVGEG